MEDSVVHTSIQDILDKTNPPFTTRSALLQIQNDCLNLRIVHAHLKQGSCPSKKLTHVRNVKRYLSFTFIASDGVLVVKHSKPFFPVSKAIVVPRFILDGLLTALHIKLNHPSRHPASSKWCFHMCASLQTFPCPLVSQSFDDLPGSHRSLLPHWRNQTSSSVDSSSLWMLHVLHCILLDTGWKAWHLMQCPHKTNCWFTPAQWL